MRGLKFIIIFIGLAALVVFGLRSCSNQEWRSFLPADLAVGRMLVSYTDISVSPGGSCGGAIFQLSSKEESNGAVRLDISKMGSSRMPEDGTRKITWRVAGSIPRDDRDYISFDCVVRKRKNNSEYISIRNSGLSSDFSYYGEVVDSDVKILIVPEHDAVLVGYWDN